MNYLPKRKPKVRMNCQPPKVVECRAHWTWIRKQEFCCLAFSRVSKVTGLVHTCEGPLDPHHARTRGAGGGDNHIVPLCRALHTRLDSPGHSQRSVEAEFGIDMLKSAEALWRTDVYHRGKFERAWREEWPGVPLPYREGTP